MPKKCNGGSLRLILPGNICDLPQRGFFVVVLDDTGEGAIVFDGAGSTLAAVGAGAFARIGFFSMMRVRLRLPPGLRSSSAVIKNLNWRILCQS